MRKPVPVAPPGPPGSLAEALAAVPEPRRPYGWRPDRPPLPLVGVLQLAVAAMLCGCRSLYAVAQWGRERVADDPAALTVLGLPPGRSPSHPTLHRVFAALDVDRLRAGAGAVADRNRGRSGRRDRPRRQDPARHPWRRGAGGAPGGGLRAPGRGGAGSGAESGQGPGTRGGQDGAGRGRRGRTAGDGGRAVDPTRRLPAHRGGGRAYLLPVDENQPALLAAVEAAFSPLDGDGHRTGGGRRRPTRGWWPNWPARRGDDGGDDR